ncbi:hypothetical protein P153DRAFT_282389 [Dothidotthia symphoricarpi CBS 119687]|uniref:DUF7820 domain-containing protein n=1 Tax=Dothidotthia symphoricarpi CBS 119687 TaxID=1392245 RepID=A0A6A6AR41_9PLEO|nr:uncharacterized protein P153DRAFT_282389 [Dothidotthia symphoricarpi CBS 119687]KAF2133465.1 hypothetical protein P153DRAFT_282389 [Dothidotthia symphoricarpi CBS 119687]
MPSVSDGFRPANASGGDHDRNDALSRHASTSKAPANDLRRTATRNSIAKVRDSMVQDGRPPNPPSRFSSGQPPLGHRDSVSSTASFATTTMGENPFETGPSHPYGMYPQHTMARPTSVATTSTDPQPHRSMSLQRPTHPYAMYSQSGLSEESPEEPERPAVPQIQTAIPMGFPGLNAGYQRVLGPDGEEQDIIGPDGHTEQLPPYSRYPDEGPTKACLAAQASASRVLPAPSPVADPDDPFLNPTSPLLTPVSPVSSTSSTSPSTPTLVSAPLLPTVTPARLPPRRPETQTGNLAPTLPLPLSTSTIPAEPSDSASDSLLAKDDESYTEKSEQVQQKAGWRKKRLLGGRVSMGVAILVAVLILTLAIVLGVLVGVLVAKKHSKDHNKDVTADKPHEPPPMPQVTGSGGVLFDATLIPTPANFATLPTGAFSLPLGLPQENNPGCLTQANQYSAWSCKMTLVPLIIVINDTSPGSDGTTQQVASVNGGPMVPKGTVQYGLQTPELVLQPLQLVLDLDYKDYGPAYHFSARYDKVVILRPEELIASSSLKRRDEDILFSQPFQVQRGDEPWYCFWNSTYIEGYIYAEDNSTAPATTGYSISSSPTASSSPDLRAVTTSTVATTARSPDVRATSTTSTTLNSPAQTFGPAVRREATASDTSSNSRMPAYSRIIKIEERRLPRSPQPYCQKMVLLDSGAIVPAPNGNAGPVRIWLQEQDPSYQAYFASQAATTTTIPNANKRELSPPMQKRSDPSNACHCQWMFK